MNDESAFNFPDTPWVMNSEEREKRLIRSFTVASLAGKDVPAIPWFIREVIPGEQVTSLYGEGAIGKTTLVMQLAVATATGGTWLGLKPDPGPVVFVTCEDTENVLHNKFADIVRGDLARLGNLHVIPLAGEDAILAAPRRGTEILEPTALWDTIVKKVEAVRPMLLIIDPLADVFGGNQISTPQAKQFINMLVRVAIRLQLAVLVCAHPSAEGMRSGSGNSGSVAWNNSVRSRMLFEMPKSDASEDPRARVLKTMKANYGPRGSELRLRWWPWGFEIDTADAANVVGAKVSVAETDVDAKFLRLLSEANAQGRYVGDKASANFAPARFEKHPKAGGITKKGFAAAMERLFANGTIRMGEVRVDSKNKAVIVVASAADKTICELTADAPPTVVNAPPTTR